LFILLLIRLQKYRETLGGWGFALDPTERQLTCSLRPPREGRKEAPVNGYYEEGYVGWENKGELRRGRKEKEEGRRVNRRFSRCEM
jgi:hypothetical protein